MIAFRFANGMFEPLWNRNYIDSVQITAAEDLGIGSRAAYYDGAGALRDLIQNHMLQLLCHVAMEPPGSFTAEDVRNEKVKVLHAIPQPTAAEIANLAVRAQYSAGHAGGEDVPGYLSEPGVPEGSTTETYAALRLGVDNWRWAGVPFYIRTGKRLITDAMRGDATLFTRNDEVEAQWRICDPLVQHWAQARGPLPSYEAGSQGPAEAEELLLQGDSWRAI